MRTQTLRGNWQLASKAHQHILSTTPRPATPEIHIAICGAADSGQRTLATSYIRDWHADKVDDSDMPTRCMRSIAEREVVVTLTYPRCEWLTHHDGGVRASMRATLARADGLLYVYDVGSRASFDGLEGIHGCVEEEKGEGRRDGVVCAVVAGGVERARTEWEVTEEAGRRLAEGWGAGFVSFDAREDRDGVVRGMVELMVREALRRREGGKGGLRKGVGKKSPLAVLKRVLSVSR
ncbi:hypothetical protein EJ05DRAFT_522176 [Pseudovirgaria hyperparasitica]|uniref:P-loop containing nucleoside triphosphate hydrolase protein n=1 Tax=Pseudovirgaria hyperparasitica TaxID=470096 RepID=A0A6A6WIN3_9PEZI|nr:uncharacterized protein EJ05DRAFT_522176 [Pseudovirgaria hyperparasitica]KAF2761930.1 hypothetical protein EJ05DRAFT_522176 [Pseudovirgaria hyperparasitica]